MLRMCSIQTYTHCLFLLLAKFKLKIVNCRMQRVPRSHELLPSEARSLATGSPGSQPASSLQRLQAGSQGSTFLGSGNKGARGCTAAGFWFLFCRAFWVGKVGQRSLPPILNWWLTAT